MASVHPRGSTSGAKAQNVEYFAADLVPGVDSDYASKFKVSVSMLNDDLEVTLDSGSTWVVLGTPTAGMHTEFTFGVRSGDTVNFRTPNAGGTTLDYFRVDEVVSEG